MSSPNAIPQWIKDCFKSIDDQNMPLYRSFFTEDAIFKFGNAPAAEGADNVVAACEGFFSAIKSLRHDLIATWADGGTLFVQGTVNYIRLDDVPMSFPFLNLVEINAEGKVAKWLIYADISPLFGPAPAAQ